MKKAVLFIEDDPLILMHVEAALIEEGFEVIKESVRQVIEIVMDYFKQKLITTIEALTEEHNAE